MLESPSGSACSDMLHFPGSKSYYCISARIVSLFKMSAQTEWEKSSVRRIHKLNIIQSVHNTTRLQKDKLAKKPHLWKEFSEDYWNSHSRVWCPKYCQLRSIKFERSNPRMTLKNKCTLKVKMYFLCAARMFQFNSGFSNWKVAGYLCSHKISNDNFPCIQNF